ncbi:DnaD domain-containing protein [Macrococcus equipercicus]|nr:DnaD domain protein [Macrococcus equipercicus]
MYLKVWIYILTKARHNPKGNFERGELLISIPELQDACSHKVGYRVEKPSKTQIFNILEWLRRTHEDTDEDYGENDDEMNTNGTMIRTTKTTRGIIVKVCNYNVYQDPKNYERNDGRNDERTTNGTTDRTTVGTMRERQGDTIHKNVKNDKELKNDKNVRSIVYDDTFQQVYQNYQENIEMNPSPMTNQKIQQDYESYGKEIMMHAIEKSAYGGNHDYKFINWLLNDWKKRKLTTVEEIKLYEQQRQTKQTYGKTNSSYEKTPDWIANKNQQVQEVSEEEKRKLEEELKNFWKEQ